MQPVIAEVRMTRAMEDMLTVQVSETLDFSGLSKGIRNRLIGALRSGLCDARTGKVAEIHHALCRYYNVPYAYYGKTSGYDYSGNSWKRTKGYALYVSKGFSEEFLETITAMSKLSGDAHNSYGGSHFGYTARKTNMDKKAVQDRITEELGTKLFKFNDVIELIRTGGSMTFPTVSV